MFATRTAAKAVESRYYTAGGHDRRGGRCSRTGQRNDHEIGLLQAGAECRVAQLEVQIELFEREPPG